MATFFIGDTHFAHKNIIKWSECRKHYTDVNHMNEDLILRWNSVVQPDDKVFMVGDFAFASRFDILARLNGRILLVLGNHEYPNKIKAILEHPHVKVCSSAEWEGGVVTHIPVHPSQLERWDFNIHGHLHEDIIEGDSRYVCVSAEQINLTPISWDDLRKKHRI